MTGGAPEPEMKRATQAMSPSEDQEVIERILKMYNDGVPIATIQEEVGRSRSAIYYQLRRNNVRVNRAAPQYPSDDVSSLLAEVAKRDARIKELERTLEQTQRMLDMCLDQRD